MCLVLVVAFSFLIINTRASASTPTGIIIPLYTYPTDGTWNATIAAKNAHPNVPIVAIINPASGSGSSIDSNYVTGIQNMKAAGITVLGYVATGYASHAILNVESQISSYKNWYGVNGIFFDEMSNLPGSENYYLTLSNYVKSNGMTMTVGNPGTDTLPSYIGTVDNMIIYETSGVPTLPYLTGWFAGYNKAGWSYLAYGVSSLDNAYEMSSANSVNYLYITNDILGNPWDTLPSYFMNEVAVLDSFNTPTTTTTTVPLPRYANITISAVRSNGQPLPGFWIDSVYDKTDNVLIANGLFTPKTIVGKIGHEYNVTVGDYGVSYVMYSNVGNFTRNILMRNGAATFTLQGNTNLSFTLLQCY